MTTQEKIEVMKAYEDGKTIQSYDLEQDKWVNCQNPTWNWLGFDYRIKPEPTYRPYKDIDEMIEDFRKKVGMGYPKLFLPSVWVKRKDGGDFAKLITEFGYSCVWLSCSDIGTPMEKLFDDFTYLDGSPCGIKEE